MNYLWPGRRPDATWFSAGPASSFPDASLLSANLAQARQCNAAFVPGCKVFHVPAEDPTGATEVSPSPDNGDETTDECRNLNQQVLVFQYKGKFHAVDHQCPHSSFPLSQGTPFDIEDFGVTLSAGLSCPKHGWSFDLFTGTGDRGGYQLKVWEVQLRDKDGAVCKPFPGKGVEDKEDLSVWVRKKQKMG